MVLKELKGQFSRALNMYICRKADECVSAPKKTRFSHNFDSWPFALLVRYHLMDSFSYPDIEQLRSIKAR